MQPIEQLLRRVVGAEAAERFDVRDLEAEREAFSVSRTTSGRTVIAGSTPIAQAVGLRWHLRNPDADSGVRPARFRHRYHFNFCTYGYTTPFWDWERWETELDELAMRGVDLPLAFVGQEAVWQRVLRRFGLTDEAIREFIGGPAYLPWWAMGCLSGWDGPLPQAWIDSHAELGRRIVDRMRELGMTPVLPAFAGHVPRGLARDARTTEIEWAGFRTHLLDAGDPLWPSLARAHLEEQAALFGGGSSYYAADPYIEVVPRAKTLEEVATVGRTVYECMRAHDPQAVWVFQSWPFTYHSEYWTPERRAAFLDAVPDDRMLLLDLWSDYKPVVPELDTRKPWLWCLLSNFGGRPGLYGNLSRLASGPAASTATGVGATMEDSVPNPIVYDLLADVGWHGAIDDLDAWLANWVAHRYRGTDVDLSRCLSAWRHLAHSVYASDGPGPPGPVAIRRPVPSGAPAPWLASESPRLDMIPGDLLDAWRLLVSAIPYSAADGPAGRDLADVSFMCLGILGNPLQRTDPAAYLELLEDLDRLLATRPEYLVGRWVADAARWGSTAAERAYYVSDALRLLTLWGPPGGELVDYARRGWAGLISSYYRRRWQLWADGPADLDAALSAFETEFVENPPEFPTEPEGNTAVVARELFEKWAP